MRTEHLTVNNDLKKACSYPDNLPEVLPATSKQNKIVDELMKISTSVKNPSNVIRVHKKVLE